MTVTLTFDLDLDLEKGFKRLAKVTYWESYYRCLSFAFSTLTEDSMS